MNRNIVLDMHTHSVSSGHAYSSMTEMMEYAYNIGLEVLGITDHAPNMPFSCGSFHFHNLHIMPKEYKGMRVMYGRELNIMDTTGTVDLDEEILERLDIVIASLHSPCIKPLKVDEATDATINAMKNKYVNIIGHPGDPRYPLDVKSVVFTSRDTSTLLEINNSSLSSKTSRVGSGAIILEILKESKKQGVPVIFNSDAHYHTYIGEFSNIYKLLNDSNLDFPQELIVNINKDSFLDVLQAKKLKNNIK